MKVHPDTPGTLNHSVQSHTDMTGISDNYKHLFFHNHLQDQLPATFCRSPAQSESRFGGSECVEVTQGVCNGSVTTGSENQLSHSVKSDMDTTDGVTEISEDSRSLPDDDDDDDDDGFTPEVQQAYKIYHSFLIEKHKAVTAPFWHPIGPGDKNHMCFKKIDDKFVNREYESITEFVADFRLMLENCYRFHGIDHWISKQAQKLEIILEQKLTLLSRTLREKTTLAVTSRGRFGTEDEKGPAGTSTRRRSVPRNLAAITVGGCESIMVQALRLEEQQRAKEEKRLRELEKKGAEEASAKEVDEWECCLLSLAEPWPISTMWELPAIGHFLCLAQTALNLPEIVFFELERCLLMPRCSSFLAKVMSSLLCQPHRRATLHRRPGLPYRRWEAELRQRVLGWYQAVGRAEDQVARAEQLGLCHRFFWILGETSPLEKTAFHLLPFNQRVWLLKGLCDHVYETQKNVQDAVLGQPIHECRESILGYDSQENAYIHFPHFCGADLRIYCQSPCAELGFPLPAFHVKKLECEAEIKECTSPFSAFSQQREFVRVKDESEESEEISSWITDEDSLQKVDDNSDYSHQNKLNAFLVPLKEESPGCKIVKEEPETEQRVKLKEEEEEEEGESDCKPDLQVGRNCFRGKSLSTDTLKPLHFIRDVTQTGEPSCQARLHCLKCSDEKPEHHSCFCFKAEEERTRSTSPGRGSRSGAETERIHSKRKRKKKKKEKSFGVKAGTGKLGLRRVRQTRANKTNLLKAASMKSKDKRIKQKLGRKFDSKKVLEENQQEAPTLPVEPTFKLVCSSLDELRDLISKTEDELDELESNKKKCGRWHFKRESVKELHITLIRLLNELLPWEPKIIKAFQRNRIRLKKESDDFMRHPDNNIFIREECVPEREGGARETRGEVEDEDKVKRNLKDESETTDYEHQLGIKSSEIDLTPGAEVNPALGVFGPLTRSSKRRLYNVMDEDWSPGKRGKLVIDDSVILDSQCEASSDQKTSPARAQSTERASAVTPPGFQGRCKPIQALLARSVGNKVTLMSHPQSSSTSQTLRLPNHTRSAAEPASRPTTSCQPTPQPAPVTTQTHTPVTSSAPVQVVYNVSEGLSLVQKDGTSFKLSVQQDQTTADKLQQVIILPSNLLIQRSEETTQKTVQTLSSSTSAFALPENKIQVQQVAPLKDTSIVKTPCTALSAAKTTSETQSLLNKPSPSVSASKCDTKQELKTVCIRDSQSILVTTRGGNTGVVKVQSSDQSGASSPVFTMPHQFHTFLVSKSSSTETSTSQAPQTASTANLLPVVSSLKDGSVSAPQTPLLKPSPLERQRGLSANHDLPFSIPDTSHTLISVNSLPASSQNNTSVPSPVKTVQGVSQISAFKSIRPPQKRGQEESPQKVFLLTSTTNTSVSSTNISTAPAHPVPASRVMFMNQPPSVSSTATIPKSSSSNTPPTSSAVEITKVRPNLTHPTVSTTSTTLTKVHGINISGVTARIVDEGQVSSPAPLTESSALCSNVLTSSSSSLIFVQNSNPTVSRCPSLNIRAPVKVTGSADLKNVTFSTYGTGHMASSALLSAGHHKSASSTASVSNVVKGRSEVLVPNLVRPSLGNLGNKDVSLQRSLITDKSWVSTTPSPLPIRASISTAVPRVPNALTLSTTTSAPSSSSPAPRPALTSLVRVPVSPITGTTSPVQEKLVINTSAPLAPGTQLLINNLRFVVPAQGLASGSHVLLISSPVAPLGASLVPSVQRDTTVTSAPQSGRVSAPGMQSLHNLRLPAPSTAALVSNVSKTQTVIPAGTRNLTNVVRLPAFLSPEVKGHNVTSSPKQTSQSVATPVCVLPPKPQITTPVTTRTSPLVTKPPMSSPVSRIQSLPVATVPPIGGTITTTQATPVTTASPSVNTVIMAACQPIRSLRMPVVITNTPQVQGKTSEQVSSSHTIQTPNKLLLSPDGAVLNVVGCPALQSLPVMAAQVVVPTCHSVTAPLNTIESQKILTSLHPERPNH